MPLVGIGWRRVQRAHDERAHRERHGETGERCGVDVAVDDPIVLRALHQLADRALSRVEPVAQRACKLGIAARGRDRIDQQRDLRAPLHEAVAEQLEQLTHLTPARAGDQRVHLGVGARADRLEQQLRLAAKVRVDGTRREAGAAGDVVHAGLLVALVDEHVDRGREQALARARRRRERSHAGMITVIIGAHTTTPRCAGRAHGRIDGVTRGASARAHVTLADVEAAAAAIRGAVVETPVWPSRTLSEITGAHVWLKFENLQFTGSFKERGARNFLEHLSSERRARGVVTASAGNHAQGLAYHAHVLGIAATIVMPADTPFTKVANTAHHGARVVLEGEGYAGAFTVAQRIAGETGATFVPAFDDAHIIAGQGTVALELLASVPELDIVVVPVGGGGLIAGAATVVKACAPGTRVIGVQVEGYAGMAHALGRAPAPTGGTTIAEGIAVTEPGILTRAIVAELVDDILVVPEQRVEEAIALGVEIEKTVLEGAGAAGLAALRHHPETFRDQRVGVVLSGGNIDARVLTSVLLRALARSGRLVRLRIEVADRPGVLAAVAQLIGERRANIVDVEHRRDRPGVALKSAVLEVSVETRDRAHAEELVAALEAGGFRVGIA